VCNHAQACDLNTHACDLKTHECNFDTQRVKLLYYNIYISLESQSDFEVNNGWRKKLPCIMIERFYI
jgi:hypothetical protein